ncbi:ABC tran domain containing protein [Trichuris trichiura]|uniref:ABC tran domain containing protein n=1 Tax=Trichuris trichiura TaxID=36087 RepID=A0A077Z799_TRITR|nr:ABC tran domain containing protein [Trichuris trichiura]
MKSLKEKSFYQLDEESEANGPSKRRVTVRQQLKVLLRKNLLVALREKDAKRRRSLMAGKVNLDIVFPLYVSAKFAHLLCDEELFDKYLVLPNGIDDKEKSRLHGLACRHSRSTLKQVDLSSLTPQISEALSALTGLNTSIRANLDWVLAWSDFLEVAYHFNLFRHVMDAWEILNQDLPVPAMLATFLCGTSPRLSEIAEKHSWQNLASKWWKFYGHVIGKDIVLTPLSPVTKKIGDKFLGHAVLVTADNFQLLRNRSHADIVEVIFGNRRIEGMFRELFLSGYLREAVARHPEVKYMTKAVRRLTYGNVLAVISFTGVDSNSTSLPNATKYAYYRVQAEVDILHAIIQDMVNSAIIAVRTGLKTNVALYAQKFPRRCGNQTIVNTPSMAGLTVPVLYLFLRLLGGFVSASFFDYHVMIQALLSMFPQFGITIVINALVRNEERKNPFGLTSLFDPLYDYGSFSYSLLILMMLLGAIIHLFFAWYLLEIRSKFFENAGGDYLKQETLHFPVDLSVEHVSMCYGIGKKGKMALKDVSAEFYAGEVTALIGANSSGKTTLLSIMCGLFPPTKGDVVLLGESISSNFGHICSFLGYCPRNNVLLNNLSEYTGLSVCATDDKDRSDFAFVLQKFYAILTVAENLNFFGSLKGIPSVELRRDINEVLKIADLCEMRHVLVENSSDIVKRKLAIAIALLGNTKVIVIDEPTFGVDRVLRHAVWSMIFSIKKKRTVIFSTQYLDEAEILADRIAIISGGELKCSGSTGFLMANNKGGCFLTFVKKPQRTSFPEVSCVKKLISYLQSYVPDVEIVQNSHKEIEFKLPITDAVTLLNLVSEIDKSLESFGCTSYGFSEGGLEDVYRNETMPTGSAEKYVSFSSTAGIIEEHQPEEELNAILRAQLAKSSEALDSFFSKLEDAVLHILLAALCFHASNKIKSPYRQLRIVDLVQLHEPSVVFIRCGTPFESNDFIIQEVAKMKYFNCKCVKHKVYCQPRAFADAIPTYKTRSGQVLVDLTGYSVIDWLTMTENSYSVRRHCSGRTILEICGIALAASVLSASFALFVTEEHRHNSRQLQYTGGMAIWIYWLVMLIFDLVSTYDLFFRTSFVQNVFLSSSAAAVVYLASNAFHLPNYACVVFSVVGITLQLFELVHHLNVLASQQAFPSW